jgi:hypothetical protein
MVTIALLSFVLVAGPHEKPVDPLGWRDLRWGMTLAEVKAAVPRMNHEWQGTEDRDGDQFWAYVITTNEWLGQNLVKEVECDFDSNGTGPLWKVGLHFAPTSKGYEELLSALKKKYRAPAFRMVSGTARVVTTRWKLPSTIVELVGSPSYSPSYGVELSYFDARHMKVDARPYKVGPPPPVDTSKL